LALSRGVGGHLRQLDGVGGWAYRVHPEGLVRTMWEIQPKWGSHQRAMRKVVAVSTLPVVRVSCDLRVDVLLLCGVAVAREKAKGGEPVDDMLPPWAG
jgi:hypothetical protein